MYTCICEVLQITVETGLYVIKSWIRNFKLEGVHKLFPTFSPAKPRNIFISEQKKPMKVKKRLKGI